MEALLEEKAKLQARIKAINRELRKYNKANNRIQGVSHPDTAKQRYLYALECENGHYYVGQSRNVGKRFAKHGGSQGSWFTRRYKPLRVVEEFSIGKVTTSHAAALENDLAYSYILRYGIEKVRGGGFIQQDPKYFQDLLARYGQVDNLDAQMFAAIENAN